MKDLLDHQDCEMQRIGRHFSLAISQTQVRWQRRRSETKKVLGRSGSSARCAKLVAACTCNCDRGVFSIPTGDVIPRSRTSARLFERTVRGLGAFPPRWRQIYLFLACVVEYLTSSPKLPQTAFVRGSDHGTPAAAVVPIGF